MLIRTQDRKQLIPFDEFVFTVTKDGKIVCDIDIITTPSEIHSRIIAEYSTEEKALKVLDMICERYDSKNGILSIDKDHAMFKECSKVFQMPQESEVE